MMQIRYAVQPRNSRHQNAAIAAGHDQKGPHWLISVVEGMRMAAAFLGNDSEDPTVRIKRITYGERNAYRLKNLSSNTRIIAYGVGKQITMIASTPPPPILTSPYMPLYPQPGQPGCEERVFSMASSKLPEAAKWCAEKMLAPTYYSNPKYAKILASYEPKADCFFAGEIIGVQESFMGGHASWLFELHGPSSDKVEVVEVLKSAIRYKQPQAGYYLVIKDHTSADVVSRGELDLFYEVH